MRVFPRLVACAAFFVSMSAFSVEPISPLLADADVDKGKRAFQLCAGCHSRKSGEGARVGPNLWNVVGRDIASTAGYRYSDGFKALKGKWDFETLNRFLYDPAGFAKGTRMMIPGTKNDATRANLIAYINTLSDSPMVLPKSAPGSVANNTAKKSPQKAVDAFSADWPQGPGRDDTGYTCSVCHSLSIVKQQGLSRDSWEEVIEWMIDEQGMSELSDEKLTMVLDYLSTHFNEVR